MTQLPPGSPERAREVLETALRGNLTSILEWQFFTGEASVSREDAETARQFKQRRNDALDRIIAAFRNEAPPVADREATIGVIKRVLVSYVNDDVSAALSVPALQYVCNRDVFIAEKIADAINPPSSIADDRMREAFEGLEWTEDGYSLRTPYDGDADDNGRPVVVGGDVVITFADSDEGDEVRMAVMDALASVTAKEGGQ